MSVQDRLERLVDLLREVRGMKQDARGFALFERRDSLAALGLSADAVDAMDAANDAALDDHIAACEAVLAHADRATRVEASPIPLAQLGSMLGGVGSAVRNATGRAMNSIAMPRWAPVHYENLPDSYDYSELNNRFDKAAQEGAALHREVFHAMVQRPTGAWDMTQRTVGDSRGADAHAMDNRFVKGAHHTHDNGGTDEWGRVPLDPRTGRPFVGGAVSGGDAAGLIKSGANFAIAQAGKQQTMFVRTDKTPKLDENARLDLKTQHDKNLQRYYDAGESWGDANLHAAKDTAARYKLGLYEGSGGVLKRVPTGY